jgi:hypothetical protein
VWHHAFGSDSKTVATVVEAASQIGQSARPDLLEALQGVAGDRNGSVNSRRLGRYLTHHLRRIEGGLRFEDSGRDGMTSRRSFRVTSVIGVIPNPTREIGSLGLLSETNAENTGNAGRVAADEDIPF